MLTELIHDTADQVRAKDVEPCVLENKRLCVSNVVPKGDGLKLWAAVVAYDDVGDRKEYVTKVVSNLRGFLKYKRFAHVNVMIQSTVPWPSLAGLPPVKGFTIEVKRYSKAWKFGLLGTHRLEAANIVHMYDWVLFLEDVSAPSFGTSSNENFLNEKVSKRISTNFSCKPDFIPQRP